MSTAERSELLKHKWLLEEELKLFLEVMIQTELELSEAIQNTSPHRLQEAMALADSVRSYQRKGFDALLSKYNALLRLLEG